MSEAIWGTLQESGYVEIRRRLAVIRTFVEIVRESTAMSMGTMVQYRDIMLTSHNMGDVVQAMCGLFDETWPGADLTKRWDKSGLVFDVTDYAGSKRKMVKQLEAFLPLAVAAWLETVNDG